MNISSVAKTIVNMATGKGPEDVVVDTSNKILAVKEVASRFPKGWETGDPGAWIPPRTYPDDVKCIHLRQPRINEFFDPNKPADLRPTAEYPVAVEPSDQKLQGIQDVQNPASADYETFVKLGKIATPRFKRRRCDDRMHIVRHPRLNNQQPMVMKIVEFPDEWAFPWLPASARAATHHYGVNPRQVNVGWDGSDFGEDRMRDEIRMHQRVEALAAGVGPKVLGLVTERGRGVIGFVSEYVPDAKSFRQLFQEAYAAGDYEFRPSEEDKRACQAVLQRLHDARLHHGDLHSGNVLRRSDGSVVLIDFEMTFYLDSEGWVYDSIQSAQMEMRRLEGWLGWTSYQWYQKHNAAMQAVE